MMQSCQDVNLGQIQTRKVEVEMPRVGDVSLVPIRLGEGNAEEVKHFIKTCNDDEESEGWNVQMHRSSNNKYYRLYRPFFCCKWTIILLASIGLMISFGFLGFKDPFYAESVIQTAPATKVSKDRKDNSECPEAKWHMSTVASNTCTNDDQYHSLWESGGSLFNSAQECCDEFFPAACTVVENCPKPDSATCKDECYNGENCMLPACSKSYCEFTCEQVVDSSTTCSRNPGCKWITCNADKCGEKTCNQCSFCTQQPLPNSTEILLKSPVTFQDVTYYKIPSTDAYYQRWGHSGRPYSYEGAPLFVDINGDGILDYFNSMHGHPLDPEDGYKGRMELAESVPYDFEDGVIPPTEYSDPTIYRLRHVSDRIIVTEDKLVGVDLHGENVLDLDGDGFLDILITSGGGRGEAKDSSRDNSLFWGKEGIDNLTMENTTFFYGGRNEAKIAGVNMPLSRGRLNYIFDANGDGLLDIFCIQDRPVNNNIIPGVLLLNNGDRTWRRDQSMQEYTRTMILTDVDGDGRAQELFMHRGFCFPQRSGPQTDPSLPDYGPFSKDVKAFCGTRPVGSTAIFKWNFTTEKMEEISPTYSEISPWSRRQPPCCPHGASSGAMDCHAMSIASADFDGDLLADHVILFQSKMEFYFSSDRPKGNYPIRPTYLGVEITLPVGCNGVSVRILDLDNDSLEEVLVVCQTPAMFLVYTMGTTKAFWTLHNGWNSPSALGDLVDFSLTKLTEFDKEDACNAVSRMPKLQPYCDKSQGKAAKIQDPRMSGIATVDLNNDGFIDIVVNYSEGYQRFFHCVPGMDAKLNQFIAFKLKGRPHVRGGSNIYGIGATVILTTKDSADNTFHSQFREFSSYQHATDKWGSKEDRIIFGLGQAKIPVSVLVRWPCGHDQVVNLNSWAFTGGSMLVIEVEEEVR